MEGMDNPPSSVHTRQLNRLNLQKLDAQGMLSYALDLADIGNGYRNYMYFVVVERVNALIN